MGKELRGKIGVEMSRMENSWRIEKQNKITKKPVNQGFLRRKYKL